MAKLQDGKGSGAQARVSSGDNRLHTSATVLTEESSKSIVNSDAFTFNTTDTADTLTVTTTKGQMLYVENTSPTKVLCVEKIILSSGAAGTRVTLQRNPVVGTIGANNTHTAVNLNFSSGKTAEATAYNWDETGTGMTGITAGTTISSFILPAGVFDAPLNGSIVLNKGDSISITVEAASGTPEFAAFIRAYYLVADDVA